MSRKGKVAQTDAKPVSAASNGAAHYDGWTNFFTGMGVAGVDRKESTSFASEYRLQETDCRNLFTYSGLARRIATLAVYDGFRKKFTIDGDTDNVMLREFKRLNAWSNLMRAGTWARVYGGAIMVVFANDGLELDEPLDENNIRDIEKIEVFERWRGARNSWYLDPSDPKYATTETWRINPVTQFPKQYVVHETRCLIFDGIDVDPIIRQGNYWWGDSVYQAIIQRLRGLGEAYSNIEHIIGEFIILVNYLKGLSMKISEGNEGDVVKRVQIQNLTRHLMGSYLADADGEKIERMSASVTGLRDIMEVLMMSVSADTGIPIRKLFGSPIQAAGLGKDGDEETQDYYDYVATDRQDNREPQVEQLCRLIMLAKQGPFRGVELANWKINWPPLREESASVQLDNKAKQKDIDRGYWDMGVMDENEIRDNRFGGDSYSHDTVLKKRDMMKENIKTEERQGLPQHNDGGEGSGNFRHEGRPGEIGGSGAGGGGKKSEWTSQSGKKITVEHVTEESNIADHTIMSKTNNVKVSVEGEGLLGYQGLSEHPKYGLIMNFGQTKLVVPKEKSEEVRGIDKDYQQRIQEGIQKAGATDLFISERNEKMSSKYGFGE